jgi:hypothetical protein
MTLINGGEVQIKDWINFVMENSLQKLTPAVQ